MLLDPATKNYYESGLVVAAVLYDLLSGGRRWLPVTCAAVLRLAFLAGAPLAVLARPQVLTPMRRHLGWAFHVRAGD